MAETAVPEITDDPDQKKKKDKDEEDFSQVQLQRIEFYRRILQNPDSEKISNPHPGLQLLDEKEHHFGDLVIMCPNPDHQDYKLNKKAISIDDVIVDYDKIFGMDSVFHSINYENELLRMAFLQVFQSLLDLDPEVLDYFERVRRVEHKKLNQKRKAIFLVQPDGQVQKANIQQRKVFGNTGFLKFNKTTDNWERTGKPVYDYGTLIRMVLIVKLSKIGGFYVRQFLSGNGENIFLVLYQENHNLLTEAERTELNMQIGLCNCDLLSLEPVGKRLNIMHNLQRLRPLRLSRQITSHKMVIKDAEHRNLKPQIVELLETINYRKLCKEIGMPPYENVGEILEDVNESKKTWIAYKYYLELVRDGVQFVRQKFKDKTSVVNLSKTEVSELIQAQLKDVTFKETSKKDYVVKQGQHLGTQEGLNLKMIKALNNRKVSEAYQEIFYYALKDTQKKFSSGLFFTKLKNLWDLAGVGPLSPYVDFFQPNFKSSFNSILAQQQIWERSILNAKGKHEVFLRMERQKLVSTMLSQTVNLNHLKNFFIPNNPYDLSGEKLDHYVKPINEALKIDQTILFSYHAQKIVTGFGKDIKQTTQGGSKKTKTILDVKPTVKSTVKPTKQKTQKKKKLSTEEKKQKLREKSKSKIRGGLNGFNLRREWGLFSLPIKQLRDYYGERVALYFKFLGFYTKYLFVIAVVGVPTFVVSQAYDQGTEQDALATILFSLFILIWASVFTSNWNNAEAKFTILYGQDDVGEDEVELINFQGKAVRSLANDKMNDLYYPESRTWMKFFVSLFLISIIIVAQAAIIIGLLEWMNYLDKKDTLPPVRFIDLNIAIPAAIWMLISLIADESFKPLSFRLTRWENHKHMSTFETSYIVKSKRILLKSVLLFSTISRLGQPFIIAFVSTNFWGCLSDNDCFSQLQIYMRVAIFMQLIKTLLLQFLIPTLRFGFKKSRRSFQKLRFETTRANSAYRKSPFYDINEYLEGESDKSNFSFNYELDGTIDQYLDLILQFGFLVNYGLAFPLVFMVSFGTNILIAKIDQLRIMEYTTKPIPLSANTLGVFKIYLELMSYGAIFSNSGLMTYTNTYTFQSYDSTSLFVLFVFVFFAFKFFMDTALSGGDKHMNEVYGRHQFIKTKIQQGYSRSRTIVHSYPSYPLMKIYGTVLPNNKKYREVDPNVVLFGDVIANIPSINELRLFSKSKHSKYASINESRILPDIKQTPEQKLTSDPKMSADTKMLADTKQVADPKSGADPKLVADPKLSQQPPKQILFDDLLLISEPKAQVVSSQNLIQKKEQI